MFPHPSFWRSSPSINRLLAQRLSAGHFPLNKGNFPPSQREHGRSSVRLPKACRVNYRRRQPRLEMSGCESEDAIDSQVRKQKCEKDSCQNVFTQRGDKKFCSFDCMNRVPEMKTPAKSRKNERKNNNSSSAFPFQEYS